MIQGPEGSLTDPSPGTSPLLPFSPVMTARREHSGASPSLAQPGEHSVGLAHTRTHALTHTKQSQACPTA